LRPRSPARKYYFFDAVALKPALENSRSSLSTGIIAPGAHRFFHYDITANQGFFVGQRHYLPFSMPQVAESCKTTIPPHISNNPWRGFFQRFLPANTFTSVLCQRILYPGDLRSIAESPRYWVKLQSALMSSRHCHAP